MSAMASQITSLTIVYLTVSSGVNHRKHQSSASLAFVRGIHRWPVSSSHRGPVTRKSFHLMTSPWDGRHSVVTRILGCYPCYITCIPLPFDVCIYTKTEPWNQRTDIITQFQDAIWKGMAETACISVSFALLASRATRRLSYLIWHTIWSSDSKFIYEYCLSLFVFLYTCTFVYCHSYDYMYMLCGCGLM